MNEKLVVRIVIIALLVLICLIVIAYRYRYTNPFIGPELNYYAPMPERVLNRPLTQEEMEVPKGQYQVGVNMERNSQVGFKAPHIKPEIEWSKKLLCILMPTNILVDSEGCTWYTAQSKSTGFYRHKLVRLDTDGSILWSKQIAFVHMVIPALVCDGAVICYEYKSRGISNKDKLNLTVECYDLQGKLIWRTEPFIDSVASHFVWRLSDNRLAVPCGYGWPSRYKICDLATGETINDLVLPDNQEIFDYGPCEIPNGGWIGFKQGEDSYDPIFLVRYSENAEILWETNLNNDFNTSVVLHPNGNVLVGLNGEVSAIDINSGKIIWNYRHDRRRFCYIKGITHDQNIVININNRITVLDKSGKELWRNDIQGGSARLSKHNLVIYEDNEILYGHNKGLIMFDHDGQVLWEMNNTDFGIDETEKLSQWCIYPAEGKRIVGHFSIWGEEDKYEMIVSLVSAD